MAGFGQRFGVEADDPTNRYLLDERADVNPRAESPEAIDSELPVANLEEERNLGADAQALLDSPAYQRIRLEMREAVNEAFAACPIRDLEGLQTIRLYLKAVDSLDENLRTTAQTGRMAAVALNEQESNRRPPE